MLHDKLKALRKGKKLSQQQVADALHLEQNTYSCIEKGKTRIDIERLKQFAEFYKKPLTEILEMPEIVVDTNSKVTKLIIDLEEQLKIKDEQIMNLLQENKALISEMRSVSNKAISSVNKSVAKKWDETGFIIVAKERSI
jgi:Helix-turn-helix.